MRPRRDNTARIWGGSSFLVGACLTVVYFFLLPKSPTLRQKAVKASCMSNLKQIGLGTIMYAQDYDECFPPASEWQTNVGPYIKNDQVFHCPGGGVGQAQPHPSDSSSYAYNSALDRMRMGGIADPEKTVSTYDSTLFLHNAHDAVKSLPKPGRHLSTNNISFADGHAKSWQDTKPLPQGQILPDSP